MSQQQNFNYGNPFVGAPQQQQQNLMSDQNFPSLGGGQQPVQQSNY